MTKKRWWAPLVAAVVTLGLAVPLGGTAAYAQSAALDVTPLAAGDVVGSLTLVGTEAMAGLSTGTDAKVPTNGGWARYKLSVTSVPGVKDVTFTTTLPEGWYTTKGANPQFDSSPNWAYYITSVYSDCVAVGTVEHCRTITTTVHNMEPDTTFTADFTAWTDTTRVNPVIQGAETGSTWQPTFAWTGGIGNIVADKPVTVVSIPTANTGKNGAVDPATVQRDFGSGLEDARSFSFTVGAGGLNGKGQRPAKIQLPTKLTDTWTVTGADKQIVELVSFTPGGAAAVACSGMTCGSVATVSNLTLTAAGGSMDIAFNANADGYGSLSYKVFVPAAQLDESGSIKMVNVISPVDWKDVSGVSASAPDRASAPVMTAPTVPVVPQWVQTDGQAWQHAGGAFLPTTVSPTVPFQAAQGPPSGTGAQNWSANNELMSLYPGSDFWSQLYYKLPRVYENPGTPAKYLPVDGLSMYGFWDNAKQQIDPNISPAAAAGGSNGGNTSITSPDQYAFKYYAGALCSDPAAAAAADPGSMTWFDSIAEAGGSEAVCGAAVAFLGNQQTLNYQGNATPRNNTFQAYFPFTLIAPIGATQSTVTYTARDGAGKLAPARVVNEIGDPEKWEVVETVQPTVGVRVVAKQFTITAPVTQVDSSVAYQGDSKEYQATPTIVLSPRTDGGETELSNLSMTFKVPGTMAGFEITDSPAGWQCVTDGNNAAGYTVSCVNPGPVTLEQGVFNGSVTQTLPPVRFAVLYDFVKSTATAVQAGVVAATSQLQGATSGAAAGNIIAPRPPQSNAMFKSANGPTEIVLPGSTLSWQNNWRTQQVLNTTQCIGDALPFVGDGRGTTGTFEFTGAAIVPGSKFTGGRLMYTTAPSATVQAAVNANNFCANGALNWSAALPSPASSVTGVMVEFASAVTGDAGAYTVTGTAVNPKVGDKFGNDSRVTTANTNTDSVVLEIVKAPAPSVSVHKTGVLVGPAEVGSPVKWTITISNTSLVDFTSVELIDPLLAGSDLVWSPATVPTQGLAKGLSATVTGTTALTQAMIDAGKAVNTATVNVTSASGDKASDKDTAEVLLPASPRLEVSKTGVANWSGSPVVGDTISWTITGMNTGNVSLTNVTLTDPLLGSSGTYTWPGAAGQLASGQQVSLKGTTTLTQADIDRGTITNAATGTGTGGGKTVTDTASKTIDWAVSGKLSVVKTGELASAAVAGEKIQWTVETINTGNVTVSGITIADAAEGFTWDAGQTVTGISLAPGKSHIATGTTEITQAQINAGFAENIATATGQAPDKTVVTDTDDAKVNLPSAGGIAIQVNGMLAAGGVPKAGDKVTWEIQVQNTGNVPLTGVAFTGAPAWVTIPAGSLPASLAPLEIVTITGTSTLTQADIDAGFQTLPLGVTGNPPTGAAVTDTDDDTVEWELDSDLHLTKTVTLDEAVAEGAAVTYTFVVKNVGDTTIRDIELTDPLLAGLPITWETWPNAEGKSLKPGQSITGTALYALTQEDIDAGIVSNTATIEGTDPSGAKVDDTDSVDLKISGADAISIQKTGVHTSPITVGDDITWSFTVQNTGAATLTDIEVTDELPEGISDIEWSTDLDGLSLAPGDKVTGTATTTVTQDIIDAGKLTNTVDVSASAAGVDEPTTDSDEFTVDWNLAPSLDVAKVGTLEGAPALGATVKWRVTVTNDGDTTINDIAITDEGITWSAGQTLTGISLAPGKSVTVNGTTKLTALDLDAGVATNTASAAGTAANDEAVDGADTAEVSFANGAAITVLKTAAVDGVPVVGTEVTWTIIATNTGLQSLSDVTVEESMAELALTYTWPGEEGDLPVGKTMTATGTTVITQDMIDAGELINTVIVSGTPGTGDVVSGTDFALVNLPNAASINVQKNGTLAGPVQAGQDVIWTINVQNTGAVTLSSVELVDSLGAPEWTSWPGSEEGVGAEGFTLAPGDDATAVLTTKLTQADIDSGSVVNNVTVSSTSPSGAAATDSDSDTVELSAASALNLAKSAQLNGFVVAGTEIDWFFTVQNTGSTTITDVEVTDEFKGLSELTFGEWPGAVGVLAPGDVVLAQATSTLTQAQIDAGVVENDATVTGLASDGSEVGSSDTARLNLGTDASIDIEETGKLAGKAVLGGEVIWTQTITNTGNVTLTDLVLTEGATRVDAAAARAAGYTFGEWPGVEGQLAPGESVTASISSYLTAEQLGVQKAIHMSWVSAEGPGEGVQATDSSMAEVVWETVTPPAPPAPGGGLSVTGGTIPFTLITIAAWMLAAGLFLMLLQRRRRSNEAN